MSEKESSMAKPDSTESSTKRRIELLLTDVREKLKADPTNPELSTQKLLLETVLQNPKGPYVPGILRQFSKRLRELEGVEYLDSAEEDEDDD